MTQSYISLFIVGMIAVIVTVGVATLILVAFSDPTVASNQSDDVFDDGVTMITNFSSQFGTVGSIAGILLLVVLVSLAGIGVYNYGRGKGMF